MNAALTYACTGGLTMCLGLLRSRHRPPHGTALLLVCALVYAALAISAVRGA